MEYCDNLSVGVIITNPANEVLLLSRARYPFGLAAPAGHVDSHGSSKLAAVEEVLEETGLEIPETSLELVISKRLVRNRCRRPGGDHHLWDVYRTSSFQGELSASKIETLGASWHPNSSLRMIANRTRQLGREALQGEQVLEPIWLDFLAETYVI